MRVRFPSPAPFFLSRLSGRCRLPTSNRAGLARFRSPHVRRCAAYFFGYLMSFLGRIWPNHTGCLENAQQNAYLAASSRRLRPKTAIRAPSSRKTYRGSSTAPADLRAEGASKSIARPVGGSALAPITRETKEIKTYRRSSTAPAHLRAKGEVKRLRAPSEGRRSAPLTRETKQLHQKTIVFC